MEENNVTEEADDSPPPGIGAVGGDDGGFYNSQIKPILEMLIPQDLVKQPMWIHIFYIFFLCFALISSIIMYVRMLKLEDMLSLAIQARGGGNVNMEESMNMHTNDINVDASARADGSQEF